MHELDDNALLRQYVEQSSEAAFATLVAHHVDKVYSVALRHTRNPHVAEEITQAVFVILARKAKSLLRHTALSGWLYETARLTTLTYIRSEIRRAHREQEAHMQSTLNGGGDASSPFTSETAWPHIAPLLDDALAKLSAADRHAVVLRYFDGKSLGEVGTTLGASEDAAKKRVARAVEKLRGFFTKRGVTLSATVLTAAISANSVQAAPLGLAGTITATVAKGTLISATITTIVNTTMKTMTWLKIKFAAGAGLAALLVGGVATVAVSQTGGAKLTPAEILQNSQAAYAALTSYSDDGKCVSVLNGTTITHTFSIKLGRPNFYRVEWTRRTESAGFTSTSEKEVIWSEGKGDFLEMLGRVRKESSKESAFGSAAGISGRASATIPGAFFTLNSVNGLGGSTANVKQKADAKVGEVDCYVLTSESQGRTKTLWIGKQDFLIHQVRFVTSAAAMKTMMAEAAKLHPEIKSPEPQDITATETHENIVVNKKFSAADFAR